MAGRDRTILMLLLDTGIRASELCGLTLDAVDLDRHDPYIKVLGKGKEEREIGLGVRARQQLHRWLYRDRSDAPDSPAVFVTRPPWPRYRRADRHHGGPLLASRLPPHLRLYLPAKRRGRDAVTCQRTAA